MGTHFLCKVGDSQLWKEGRKEKTWLQEWVSLRQTSWSKPHREAEHWQNDLKAVKARHPRKFSSLPWVYTLRLKRSRLGFLYGEKNLYAANYDVLIGRNETEIKFKQEFTSLGFILKSFSAKFFLPHPHTQIAKRFHLRRPSYWQWLPGVLMGLSLSSLV